MEKTAVTSCVLLLFISSLLLVDGMVILRKRPTPKPTPRRTFRKEYLERTSDFVVNEDGKRVSPQRGQEFRRNICLSARDLDCEREIQ
ncbi:hypothetical protein ACROYT_G025175 [Oculina patagonica]